MARKLIKKPPETLERILENCLKLVGVEIEKNKAKLLLRLIISGIGNHYFSSPDDLIDVGFLRFQKSPDKDELFRVKILRNNSEGIINANALLRYYTGDLKREKDLKNSLENFLTNLINYAQEQEIEITKSINQIEKKEDNNNGI